MVNTSQSVPSTQVVSSVVAPAIPLPAQVAEEPLTGLSVPEVGVDAKAGNTNAQHMATRSITLKFKFEGLALLGNSANIDGHKDASSFWISGGPGTALSCALLKQATTAGYVSRVCL